jgi:dihydroorotate dehydrogenase electron transfer subunit
MHANAFTLPTAVTITAVHQENYRTKTFVLDAALPATPGQFVMAWLPRFDEKPFSLVDADPVTLMVTAVGPFSQLLHQRGPGDRLWLRGPFGHGFTVDDSQRRLALVGGGYGVAPLHWLARSQHGRAQQITAIVGARTAADLLYAARFRRLNGDATRHSLILTTEDGSAGVPGRVTDALAPLLDAGAVDAIFACGPHGMLEALARLGRRHGVPCQLSWEAYMRCGIGICGACEHEGKVICLDGPVLRAAD